MRVEMRLKEKMRGNDVRRGRACLYYLSFQNEEKKDFIAQQSGLVIVHFRHNISLRLYICIKST